MNPDVARIFQSSFRGAHEFPNLPPGLRNAISLARLVLDPIGELAGLWLEDPVAKKRDILSLQMHHLQRILPHDLLLKRIERVFMDQINELGVNLNGMINRPHRQGKL